MRNACCSEIVLLHNLCKTSLCMTELAEYVFNRNIAKKDEDEPSLIGEGIDMPDSGQEHTMRYQRQTSITYDFQLLDDVLPEDASEDNEVI